jgi:hypothetical protein
MASRYYLDTDTTPALRGRFAYKGLDATISFALGLVGRCTDGQIGIYTSARGDGFKGYAINDGVNAPYFEAATETAP